MLKRTYRLNERFLQARPQLNHSTHICNIAVKDSQTFRVEMGFVVGEIVIFQILPLVWFPCSLMLHCVVSRHQAHLPT